MSMSIRATASSQGAAYFMQKIAPSVRTAAICAFSAYLASYIGLFLLAHDLPGPRPSYVYAMLMAFAFAVILFSDDAKKEIARQSWTLHLLAIYIAFIAIQVAVSAASEMRIQVFIFRVEFVASLVALIGLFGIANARQPVRMTLLGVNIFGSLMNFVQLAEPRLFIDPSHPVIDRAYGLYLNPNSSGLFIATLIPLTASILPKSLRYGYYALTLAAVILTFSRGAWLLWILAVVITETFLSEARSGHRRLLPRIVAIGLVLGALYVLFLTFSDFIAPYLSANTWSRLHGTHDTSIEQRIFLIRLGLQQFADNPLFGSGIGESYLWSYGQDLHNMFVMFLAEHGLFGLVILIALLIAWWRANETFGPPLVILFLASSVATNNFFDNPSYALLVAAYIAGRLPDQVNNKRSPPTARRRRLTPVNVTVEGS